jgi:hypothetical protein
MHNQSSEDFGNVPHAAERFGTFPQPSESFENVPKASEDFGNLPSPRHPRHKNVRWLLPLAKEVLVTVEDFSYDTVRGRFKPSNRRVKNVGEHALVVSVYRDGD